MKQRGVITVFLAGWIAIASLGGVVAIDQSNAKDKVTAYHSVQESIAAYYASKK